MVKMKTNVMVNIHTLWCLHKVWMLKASNPIPLGSFVFILIVFLTLKLHSAMAQTKIPEICASPWSKSQVKNEGNALLCACLMEAAIKTYPLNKRSKKYYNLLMPEVHISLEYRKPLLVPWTCSAFLAPIESHPQGYVKTVLLHIYFCISGMSTEGVF